MPSVVVIVGFAAVISLVSFAMNLVVINRTGFEFVPLTGIGRLSLEKGTADYVVINNGTGYVSEEAQLAASRGGTGQDSSTSTGIPTVTAGEWSFACSIDSASCANLTVPGILLPTGAPAVLDTHSETTFNVTWQGPWAAPHSANLLITRIGKIVTLSAASVSFTSASAATITAPSNALATYYRPVAAKEFLITILDDGTKKVGNIIIATTGLMTIGASVTGANFAGAAGATGWTNNWSVTYRIS
jgi:hypothetical protein